MLEFIQGIIAFISALVLVVVSPIYTPPQRTSIPIPAQIEATESAVVSTPTLSPTFTPTIKPKQEVKAVSTTAPTPTLTTTVSPTSVPTPESTPISTQAPVYSYTNNDYEAELRQKQLEVLQQQQEATKKAQEELTKKCEPIKQEKYNLEKQVKDKEWEIINLYDTMLQKAKGSGYVTYDRFLRAYELRKSEHERELSKLKFELNSYISNNSECF